MAPMTHVFSRFWAILTLSSALENPIQYYYCGRKTFSDTPVTVSKDSKFVTDLTNQSMQNLTTGPGSFIIDVTGCVTPIGELVEAVGIEIKYNDLPNVYAGAVQNLKLLKMVRMEHCGIRDIEPGALLELPSIETIFLRFNLLERVHEGVFSNLNAVRIFLNNNSISSIDPGAFDNMPNLAMVELDSNELKTWNTDWFTNSPNVEHLSLDSNEFTTLPANAFRNLKNQYTTSIRLSNNQIVYIHPTAFHGLDLLYALWLDHNHINELDDGVFSHFERIYILSLAGNNIECLSEDLLYNLRSPEMILHVEDNKPMDCECLREVEKWAKARGHFFTERYAKNECSKKREKKPVFC